MSTEHVVVTEQPFEVTAVEFTQELHKTSGVLIKNSCKFHANRESVIAVSKKAARSKIERRITKACKTDAEAESLIDRLKVRVDLIENFQD